MKKSEVEFLNALRKVGLSRSLCESVNGIRKAVFEAEEDITPDNVFRMIETVLNINDNYKSLLDMLEREEDKDRIEKIIDLYENGTLTTVELCSQTLGVLLRALGKNKMLSKLRQAIYDAQGNGTVKSILRMDMSKVERETIISKAKDLWDYIIECYDHIVDKNNDEIHHIDDVADAIRNLLLYENNNPARKIMLDDD